MATISGGLDNVSYDPATIRGGKQNRVWFSQHGIIMGGKENFLAGDLSAVFSGELNSVRADRGITAGRNATVTNNRSTVFGLTSSANDARASDFVIAADAFTLKIGKCPDLTIDGSNVNILRAAIAAISAHSIGVRSRSLLKSDAVMEDLEIQIELQMEQIEELTAMVYGLNTN